MHKNLLIAALIGICVTGMTACTNGDEKADDTVTTVTTVPVTTEPTKSETTTTTTETRSPSESMPVNPPSSNAVPTPAEGGVVHPTPETRPAPTSENNVNVNPVENQALDANQQQVAINTDASANPAEAVNQNENPAIDNNAQSQPSANQQ